MKCCSRCKINKPLDCFSKLGSAKDGLQSKCKQCFSEYNKKRYEEKGEEIRAKVNARAKALGKDLYEKFQRPYAQEYYKKNREKMLAASAARDKANPEARKGRKARHRARTLISMSKLDRKKSTLHRKRIKNDPCFYCKGFTSTMHDDHYFPLARGGTDHWFNIVRACSTCNQKKNSRLVSQGI